MKTCKNCREAKSLFDFHPRKGAKDGLRNDCRACCLERNRANYTKNREHILAQKRHPAARAANVVSRRKTITGFTPDLFDAIKAFQGHSCAICLRPFSSLPLKHIHADHCHQTKQPRGVLCHWCNAALGHLGDDADNLRRALAYLAAPPAQFV